MLFCPRIVCWWLCWVVYDGCVFTDDQQGCQYPVNGRFRQPTKVMSRDSPSSEFFGVKRFGFHHLVLVGIIYLQTSTLLKPNGEMPERNCQRHHLLANLSREKLPAFPTNSSIPIFHQISRSGPEALKAFSGWFQPLMVEFQLAFLVDGISFKIGDSYDSQKPLNPKI